MEKDFDTKLYHQYLNGEKEAFELLYNRYKNKIKYFVFNMVKDYEKAEDITQDTFMYVLQNPTRQENTFQSYIYQVARSKAINAANKEKRRTQIHEKYFSEEAEPIEQDVIETITKNEKQKELLEAIGELKDTYKNAIYLVKIEGLSYQETAEILGESIQNIKNLIHRSKKELRKILLKKGFYEMKKGIKVLVILISAAILLTGITYAVTKVYHTLNKNHQVTFYPTYQSTLDESTVNQLWIGTLDLAWKDLKGKIKHKTIDLEEGNLPIVDELNNSTFSKQDLDSNDYEIKVERTHTDGYKIDATLKKELNFLEVFDNFSNQYQFTFGDGQAYIKYFGINNASLESMNKNVEILFFNRENDNSFLSNDFAIKLKTKEGDEIILYRTNEEQSFDEYYQAIKEKEKSYTGRREFSEEDELRIPYVRVNGMVCYNELFGKEIKNSNGLIIYDVIQNVNFSLNEKGCNLSSQATMVTEYLSASMDTKYCYFQDQFVIFMKEANSNKPYFALKVDNDDILEKQEDTDEPILHDFTMMKDAEKYVVEQGEYLFFEDENYEYYFPTHKTKFVHVYFKDGENLTAEQALKEGKITLDLLDKYGVEYRKKEKAAK